MRKSASFSSSKKTTIIKTITTFKSVFQNSSLDPKSVIFYEAQDNEDERSSEKWGTFAPYAML